MSVSEPNLPLPRMPVYSVGRDQVLLHLRQHAMDEAAIPARTLTPEQAEAFIHDAQPRLWIFCASIDTASLVYLSSSIRRYSPESRLLLVEYGLASGSEAALFHRLLHGMREVGELIRVVRETKFGGQDGAARAESQARHSA